MATTKFYTVTVFAMNTKGCIKMDGARERLGDKNVIGVYRELYHAKETFDWFVGDVSSHGFYDADDCRIALWASRDIEETAVNGLEERLGHNLDYFTEVGGEVDYKAFVCELMPSEFARSCELFGEEIDSCAWDEEC